MQKQNPLLRIWGWGKDEHGRLIGAVISALIAVLLGMLPYFAAAQVIIGMLAWEKDLSFYLPWLGLGLAGYAARTLLYNMALSVSHKATFSILKNIRQRILEKLPKLPLAHRLTTICNADQILVIEQGRIEQNGTHEELLKQNGTYADMWKAGQDSAAWIIKNGDSQEKEDAVRQNQRKEAYAQ